MGEERPGPGPEGGRQPARESADSWTTRTPPPATGWRWPAILGSSLICPASGSRPPSPGSTLPTTTRGRTCWRGALDPKLRMPALQT